MVIISNITIKNYASRNGYFLQFYISYEKDMPGTVLVK